MKMDIWGLHSAEAHRYLQYSQLYFFCICNHELNWECVYYNLLVHIRCQQTVLCRRQPIWLQHVGWWAHNNTQMTMWEHQIIMLEIHKGKALNSGNPQIKVNLHQGIVTGLRSHHFQALPSFSTIPHSPWHQAHNQVLVQHNDIWVMGHCGKHMISPKELMVDLKYSPLSNSQGMGRHLQAHLRCIQHALKIIQPMGRYLPPLLHRDNFLAHQGVPPLSSEQHDFCQLQNYEGQMLQRLLICPHYLKFPVTNTMQIMRATIHWTCAGPKAKRQSAWTKWNSPWSNLPKEWGSPTLVPSTNGRKYGWLGFWRRNIGQLSRDRTVWNSIEIDLCTGRWRMQIFWRLSRLHCSWKILIMLNGFGDSGLRCFWRNVQVRFGRRGRREGQAPSDRRRIWESALATQWEIMSQNCQMQLSWLWFVECRTATMTRHPLCNSKLRTQMSGAGRSWLISLKKIAAWKNHTVWLWYANATRCKKN